MPIKYDTGPDDPVETILANITALTTSGSGWVLQPQPTATPYTLDSTCQILSSAVSPEPDLDITIWNGGPGGLVVPDGEEESLGAFTVANWNDTDGDGVTDFTDTDGVVASAKGRDEVDLIMILIVKPENYAGGAVTITVVSGSVAFWNDSTKTSRLDPLQLADWRESEVARIIYMECTAPSTAVRDIKVTIGYAAQTTSFTATSVWGSIRAVSHDQATYNEVVSQGNFAKVHTEPEHVLVRSSLRELGGTGLKHIPAMRSDAFNNSIVFAFEITPRDVHKERNVHFDLARRAEHLWWSRKDGKNTVRRRDKFPDKVEYANDDPHPLDESTNPDADSVMFQFDAPGLSLPHEPTLAAGTKFFHNQDANFEEFMRVSFNGNEPEGNGEVGTQASGKYNWYSNIFAAYSTTADVWYRATDGGAPDSTTETEFNAVGDGSRPLDEPPM